MVLFDPITPNMLSRSLQCLLFYQSYFFFFFFSWNQPEICLRDLKCLFVLYVQPRIVISWNLFNREVDLGDYLHQHYIERKMIYFASKEVKLLLDSLTSDCLFKIYYLYPKFLGLLDKVWKAFQKGNHRLYYSDSRLALSVYFKESLLLGFIFDR